MWMRNDDYKHTIYDAWRIEIVHMNNKAFLQLIKNCEDNFTY